MGVKLLAAGLVSAACAWNVQGLYAEHIEYVNPADDPRRTK